MSEIAIKKKKSKIDRSSKVFYWVMFALPLIQFLIFYVAVNFNSVLMAFENIYKTSDNGNVVYVTEFVWFDTLKKFITVELVKTEYTTAIVNSLIYLVFSVCCVIPLGLIFSFYIYKKYPLSKLYRTFLFLPSVICSLVLVIFYSYFADLVVPEIFGSNQSLLRNFDNTVNYLTLLFFNFFFNFGPATLIYVNAMSQIDVSVVEAAELDGAVGFRQFWHVVLPLIFPSITSYIIICIAQVASDQMNAFSFYNTSAKDWGVQSIGYNLFVLGYDTRYLEKFPTAAAGGIFFTLIVAPLTLFVRWLIIKFGPSED